MGIITATDHDVIEERSPASWQKPALAALWAVLLMFAGWMWVTNQAAQTEMRSDIQAIRQDRATDLQRTAILEEAVRNQRESLQRIEAGVDELRRERGRR